MRSDRAYGMDYGISYV